MQSVVSLSFLFGKSKSKFSIFKFIGSIFKHWKIILVVILIIFILILIKKLKDAMDGGKILAKGVLAPFKFLKRSRNAVKQHHSVSVPKVKKSEITGFDEYDDYDE